MPAGFTGSIFKTAFAPLLAVAQILLSGPTVRLNGDVKPLGNGKSSITGGLPGFTLPILFAACSVNHRSPSGPSTMSSGSDAGVGTSNSFTVGSAAAGAAARSSSGSSAMIALSQCLIQYLIHEFVRAGVLLAPYGPHGPPVETA